MAKQVNVHLGDSEHGIVERRAAAWGITPHEYARLQMRATAADWGMRRVLVPAASAQQFLDCPDGELEKLPSGWFKIAGERQWFWIEGVSDVE